MPEYHNIYFAFCCCLVISVTSKAELLPLRPKVGTVCLDCQQIATASLVCSDKERIAFKGIYYGAKKADKSCQKGTKFQCSGGSTPSCCVPDGGTDCVITAEKDYYSPCTGRKSCTINFSDDKMTCSKYPDITRPNYAGISYFCIPETGFIYLDTSSSVSAKTVYMTNTGYPSPMEPFTTLRCSIQTAIDKTLNLVALDVFLTHEKDTGCLQEITIRDGRTLVTKDCFQNNNFRPVEYYTSTNYFMVVTITNKKTDSGGSFVWLAVMESSSEEDVTVKCGKYAVKKPSSPSVTTERVSVPDGAVASVPGRVTIPVVLTQSTTNSTPEAPVTGESTGAAEGDDNQVKIITITLMLILLVAVGVGFGIFYYKKKHGKVSPDDDEEEEVISASTESILPKPPVPVRAAPRTSSRNGDDDPAPSTSGEDDRRPAARKKVEPPPKDFPAIPTRRGGRVLPSLGEPKLPALPPESTVIPRTRRSRKILPRIGSRLPNIQDSDEED